MHVIIVGGGLSGLMAARRLCQEALSSSSASATTSTTTTTTTTRKLRITLVEAKGRLGGRVCANDTFVPGYPLDIGAEFVHGNNTKLTETIQAYELAAFEDWESYFVTAHADGGPDEFPTRDGKYGMYYVNGELLMYNDQRLKLLSEALEAMGRTSKDDHQRSVEQALDTFNLDPSLKRLAVAGYGNTAGNVDMQKLSLKILAQFESHWDENEMDGDYRLPAHLGMTSVVRAIQRELSQDDRISIKLGWPVDTIVMNECDKKSVIVKGLNGEVLKADAVICTVPPPLLPRVLPTLLTDAQKETLSYIGFETVCKVILKFKVRPWPDYLQSVICADGGPLPEIWFRNDFVVEGQSYHLMVGYLSSGLADDFLKQIQDIARHESISTDQAATNLCLGQLCNVLSVPQENLRNHHVDTLVHAWNAETEPYTPGGYMYPKAGLKTLAPMAEPCAHGRVFLAGEATNSHACGTVQAAMETGVRAAEQVISKFF